MSVPGPGRSPRKDLHSVEERRVQVKTWTVIAVVWVVIATSVLFDRDSNPWVRSMVVVVGALQALAGFVWWRKLRQDRRPNDG
jgi:undecaprenyl pyrophosphate phosphatase UppP